jgi:hypothetical protein
MRKGSKKASIDGAWHMETYVRDGRPVPLQGSLLFVAGRWSTLYFVAKTPGSAYWGSAESGRYKLENDCLTFQHEFTFQGATDTPLKIELASSIVETCAIELHATTLVIHFPSGNVIHCRRASA